MSYFVRCRATVSVAAGPQNYLSPIYDVCTSRMFPGHSSQRCGYLNALICGIAWKARHTPLSDPDAGKPMGPQLRKHAHWHGQQSRHVLVDDSSLLSVYPRVDDAQAIAKFFRKPTVV